jgi:hypothetical protein
MHRIERAVLKRVAGRRHVVSGSEHGLVVRAADGESASLAVPWSQIDRVVLTARDAFVGESMVLVFQAREGRVVQADESMPQWRDLARAMDAHLPGVMPSRQWIIDFLAQGRRHEPVQIFERGGAAAASTDRSN